MTLSWPQKNEQSIVYVVLMFLLKSGYFSGAFKIAQRITQADFDAQAQGLTNTNSH